jgi:hypothetical protein
MNADSSPNKSLPCYQVGPTDFRVSPLDGHFRREHAFLLKRLPMQTRFLEQHERSLRREVVQHLDEPARRAIGLWDTIPGVNEAVAWAMVAEMGTRVEQFPDAHHAASWTATLQGTMRAQVSGDLAKPAKEITCYERRFVRQLGRHRVPRVPILRRCFGGLLHGRARSAPSLRLDTPF